MMGDKKKVCLVIVSMLLLIFSADALASESDGCGLCKQCTDGLCFNICAGFSFSCGCTSCFNCDLQDACVGTTYHDYYCSGTDCVSTTTANDPRCVMKEVCSTPGDEDNNDECDYDSSVCSHGDPACPVGVTAISVSNSNPSEGSSITVDCTPTAFGVNSIEASIDGVGLCNFDSWVGSAARFICANLGSPGEKTARCSVNTLKSYKSGDDKTAIINVLPSTCSTYSTSFSCEADSRCDWCLGCVGVEYTGGIDRCVAAGSCPLSYCWLGQCGAVCDSTAGGCSSPSTCDLSTCSCTEASCSDDCSPGSTQCSDGTHYQTCGNFDADSCLDWSTPVGCSAGEFCNAGVCMPCAGSEVCDNDVDDDCDGFADCEDSDDCCANPHCSSDTHCCVLSNARWDVADNCPGDTEIVKNGKLLKLVASGNSACEGKSLRFRVFWTWLGIKYYTATYPDSAVFSSGEVSSDWVVVWEDANPLPWMSSNPSYDFFVDGIGVAPVYSTNKIKVCLVDGKTDDDCDGVPDDMDECSGTPCNSDDVITAEDCTGCTPEQCACVSQIDCTGVEWSECDENNQMTRNICKGADTDPLTCCNSQDTCRCTINTCTGNSNWIPVRRDCSIEEEFPFFTSYNIIFVLIIIAAFYVYYTLKRPKNKRFGGLK